MKDRFCQWLGEMKAIWFTHSSKQDIARAAFKAGMKEAVKVLKEKKGLEPCTDDREAELESCIYDIESEIKRLDK